MSWTQIADVVAAACFLLGALLAMIAAIGVLRLPGPAQPDARRHEAPGPRPRAHPDRAGAPATRT